MCLEESKNWKNGFHKFASFLRNKARMKINLLRRNMVGTKCKVSFLSLTFPYYVLGQHGYTF